MLPSIRFEFASLKYTELEKLEEQGNAVVTSESVNGTRIFL
jgi:hypothetical protein